MQIINANIGGKVHEFKDTHARDVFIRKVMSGEICAETVEPQTVEPQPPSENNSMSRIELEKTLLIQATTIQGMMSMLAQRQVQSRDRGDNRPTRAHLENVVMQLTDAKEEIKKSNDLLHHRQSIITTLSVEVEALRELLNESVHCVAEKVGQLQVKAMTLNMPQQQINECIEERNKVTRLLNEIRTILTK